MGFDPKRWSKHKKAMGKNWDQYAKAERTGFDMPGPIRNGVARLSEVEFKDWESEEGTVDIVEITGVIVLPSEHKGRKVRVSHFLRDGEFRTLEEVYNDMSADLRACGIDMSDPDNIPAQVDAAVKQHKAFSFNTKVAKKSKNVFMEIIGPATLEEAAPKTKAPPKDEAPEGESDKAAPWSDEDPFQ